MEEGDEVREGFLCPVCHLDLGTFQQLEVHYEQTHSSTSSTNFNSFKELIGKAKKKILKVGSEEETQESVSNTAYNFDYSTYLSDYQKDGLQRSHTSYFKDIRNLRTKQYFVEINKLLIRLDKLLCELPSDPAKRKAYERSMVDWAPDEDVPLCPSCAQRFRLMRRKHHCRLCGSIMCDACSNFITQTYARKLTSANSGGGGEQRNVDSVTGAVTPVTAFPSILISLPRSGSLSSLNSIISSSGELHFRLCNHCKTLLDSHNERMELQNSKLAIEHLYEKLKSSMREGDELCPRYFQMVDSLRSGATTYTAEDVQALRLKLMRLAETIDVFSQKILLLGTKSETQPSERCLRLQKGICMSAKTFLKVKMLGLPLAPTEAEIITIREQKQREAEQRAREEQQMLLAAQKRLSKREAGGSRDKFPPSTTERARESVVSYRSDGWNPESNVLDSPNQNPIVQQMEIIRNYIEQAKAAYKLEEVEMLSNNLRELQEEYWRECDRKK